MQVRPSAPNGDRDVSAARRPGPARHRLRHRGSVVTQGTKYMLRTDAMYFPLTGAGTSAFPSLAELQTETL